MYLPHFLNLTPVADSKKRDPPLFSLKDRGGHCGDEPEAGDSHLNSLAGGVSFLAKSPYPAICFFVSAVLPTDSNLYGMETLRWRG
jgi:hypothetical protein